MSDLALWHQRLSHASLPMVKKALSSIKISYNHNKDNVTLCLACSIRKIHAPPYFPSTHHVAISYEIVHLDVWVDPFASSNGQGYYMHFIDAFSCYTWIFFLKTKNAIFQDFVQFKT